jgi:predicted small secreted protein
MTDRIRRLAPLFAVALALLLAACKNGSGSGY